MDRDRFDELAKILAESKGTDRRTVLKRVAAGGFAGLLALRGGAAAAQPGCRREGHPCEGNQVCCPGLVCTPAAGPGQAARCARPPRTTTTTTKAPKKTTTTTTKAPKRTTTTTTKAPKKHY